MRPFFATMAAIASLTWASSRMSKAWSLAGAAGRLDLGLHRRELLGLAAGDGDVGAERRDLVRGAAADAAAAAGHDHGPAVKQPRLEDRAIRHPSSRLNGCSSACI
jgi:hypothetical protein